MTRQRQSKEDVVERVKKSSDVFEECPAKFEKWFVRQVYVLACVVCDRMWFPNDLKAVRERHKAVLKFMGGAKRFKKVYATCSQSLAKGKFPPWLCSMDLHILNFRKPCKSWM